MPRTPRIDLADYVYHVLNRANGRLPIFENDKDYQHFESVLTGLYRVSHLYYLKSVV